VLVLAAIATAIGFGTWVLTTASGSTWLLAQVPGLRVLGPHGVLLDAFTADRVELSLAAGVLRIDALAWRGARVGRGPPGAWVRLGFEDLRAARVEWNTAASKPGAAGGAPSDLRLPIAVDVAHAHVDEARFGAGDDAVLRDLDASVHLDADDGAAHRVEHASFRWGRLTIAGSAQIATQQQLNVEANIEATQPAEGAVPDWRAQARAIGPLAALHVTAGVKAQRSARQPAQRLDLTADVRPFQAWPLGDVNLALANFDVGALQTGLPITRLSGRAEVRTQGLDRPASVRVQVVNAAPGRWNEARVPVRTLDVTLSARPDDWRTLDVTALTADLADDRQPAGSVRGTGRWTSDRWSLEATLVDLQTQRLDGRAPSWRLGGTVAARSEGTASIALQGALDGRIA